MVFDYKNKHHCSTDKLMQRGNNITCWGNNFGIWSYTESLIPGVLSARRLIWFSSGTVEGRWVESSGTLCLCIPLLALSLSSVLFIAVYDSHTLSSLSFSKQSLLHFCLLAEEEWGLSFSSLWGDDVEQLEGRGDRTHRTPHAART